MFLWAQSTELYTSLHNSVCVHSYHTSPLSKIVHLIMFDRALSVIHIIPQVSLLCTTLAHTHTELLITLVFYRYLMKSPKLKALFTIKFTDWQSLWVLPTMDAKTCAINVSTAISLPTNNSCKFHPWWIQKLHSHQLL